mgnify:CR=1 FL=1
MTIKFFEDFEISTLKIKNGYIRFRKAGHGPALLMLHGNPQTHVMWHKVAPALTKKFTIICPDIPGYGKSYKPKRYISFIDWNEFIAWYCFDGLYIK